MFCTHGRRKTYKKYIGLNIVLTPIGQQQIFLQRVLAEHFMRSAVENPSEQKNQFNLLRKQIDNDM